MSTKLFPTSINEIAYIIGQWRRSKGFKTPVSMGTERERDDLLGKLMLVVTEVAEAAEAVRHDDAANFREEIADTIIRLLDISEAQGIDVYHEIRTKMETNAKRPPLHGKATSL